jgi:hypothetical protein
LHILQIQPTNYEAQAELVAVRAGLAEAEGRPIAEASTSTSAAAAVELPADDDNKLDIPFQLYEADQRSLRIACDASKRHWTALQITRARD